MRLSFAAWGTALLATTVFAAPSSFLSRRGAALDNSTVSVDDAGVFLNGIWAGATIEQPPTGTFTKVSGQFIVPVATRPPGGAAGKQYATATWVGIGGNPLLQAGVDSIITADGKHEYSAWYEWFPKPSGPLTGLDLAAGDKIEVVIETSGPNANGKVTIHNLSKSKTAAKTLPSPGHHGDMTANWIVEDFTVGDGPAPFADFKSVTFTNCVAHTNGGTYGLGRAHPDDIQQNGKRLTKSTIDGTSKVNIKYIG